MIGPLDAQKDKRYTLWRAIQPRKDIGDIASGQGKVSKRTRLTPFSLTTGYAGSQADHIVQRRHKDLSRQGPAQRTKLRSSLSCLPAKDMSRLGGPCPLWMGHRKKDGLAPGLIVSGIMKLNGTCNLQQHSWPQALRSHVNCQ